MCINWTTTNVENNDHVFKDNSLNPESPPEQAPFQCVRKSDCPYLTTSRSVYARINPLLQNEEMPTDPSTTKVENNVEAYEHEESYVGSPFEPNEEIGIDSSTMEVENNTEVFMNNGSISECPPVQVRFLCNYRSN